MSSPLFAPIFAFNLAIINVCISLQQIDIAINKINYLYRLLNCLLINNLNP